jgi:hypothetical protein
MISTSDIEEPTRRSSDGGDAVLSARAASALPDMS